MKLRIVDGKGNEVGSVEIDDVIHLSSGGKKYVRASVQVANFGMSAPLWERKGKADKAAKPTVGKFML